MIQVLGVERVQDAGESETHGRRIILRPEARQDTRKDQSR
jgi:hypothetical protein